MVLDCKVGHGAFMKTIDEARTLASAIRAIGAAAGKPVTVVVTDMNAPIGWAVGNALEIAESIETLKGAGPADTRELTCVLGGEMLALAGLAADGDAGRARIASSLDDGSALEVFRQMVEAQGGDANVTDDPSSVLPQAKNKRVLEADSAGVIGAIRARDVGIAGLRLGAGRTKVTDSIDPAAGIELHCRVGDPVEVGQPVATLHYNDRDPDPVLSELSRAIEIAAQPGETTSGSRVIETIR